VPKRSFGGQSYVLTLLFVMPANRIFKTAS
jgi:hypothetical protein